MTFPVDLPLSRRCGLLFLLGGLMALAMPPLGIFPILLFCVPGFIALARAEAGRVRGFLCGWAFGSGYFIAGLYWISAALFVDIGRWGWVMPLSLVVGPGLFGLYYGFIPLLARPFRKDPVSHALFFVAAWSLVEWLRGVLLTGFPWNAIGYAWMHDLPVMQAAAFVGVSGLTLLTLLWAAIPALKGRRRIVEVLGASFLLVTLLGMARLYMNPADGSGPLVRIVQANIPQTAKWSREEQARNFERHLALSRSDSKPSPAAVIWPETAIAGDEGALEAAAKRIGAVLEPGAVAISGTLRVVTGEGEEPEFFNSASVILSDGTLAAHYDKHHLVPFGEYIPFRRALNLTPIAAAVSGIGDFTRGGGPRRVKAGSLPPFSPLICYEAIFAHEAAPHSARPDWLVNVTNDGWYGHTAGPYQHFEIARMRTLEQGLPLARAANTGISGMIDPLGRVMAKQPLGTTGVIDAPLPPALTPTLYARFGDLVFLGMLGLLVLAASVLRFKTTS